MTMSKGSSGPEAAPGVFLHHCLVRNLIILRKFRNSHESEKKTIV